MGVFHEVMKTIEGKTAGPVNPEDYMGEDGLMMCGQCHTPRELRLADISDLPIETLDELFGAGKKVPVFCQCRKEQAERKDAEAARRAAAGRIAMARRHCFHTAEDAACTFAIDDRKNPAVSDAVRRYAEQFGTMQGSNTGLLLYGPVGTGKTFLSACVANHVLAQGYSAEMTNFSRVVNDIQSSWEGKQEYIDRLVRKDLLIIDDLGIERESEFMQEQVYNIVDARYKSGKPLIVTTNISLEEIKNPKNEQRMRIYDRILEMCHPIKVDGASRRRKAVRENYAERNRLLGL